MTLGEGKVVDLLRAPRRVRGPCETCPPRKRIDKRGFPNIGASGKADLNPIIRGQAGHGDNAFKKVGIASGKEFAAFFAADVVRFFCDGEGQLHQSTSILSSTVIVPGVVTTAWTLIS